MTNNETAKTTLALGVAAPAAAQTAAQTAPPTLDDAFNTLKTYDWGADRRALQPIDEAIAATHGDAAARRTLERRLVDTLAGGLSRSAQDYVCRKLRIVGTAQALKVLAALLPVEETSHIARYALEFIPDRRAVETMRSTLPKVSDKLKPGLIGSLGRRRDSASVRAIVRLLGHSDVQVARAAAQALGLIGTWAAAQALGRFAKTAPAHMKMPLADARLLCAEQLRVDGRKAEALALYQELRANDQSAHVKVAAMRGMATTAAKK